AAVGEVEIIEAIKRLKLEKSPGPDNITNEALKTAHTILATPLAELFNLILQKSETPTQWSESNIILLYKKGDPKDIGNYRPISLLPTLYKLFSTIINARISPTIGARQPVEQAGFRKAFSTIDHIHTLELIIEKYQEHQRPLYLAFIDYQKAFDTVTHASIWESLKKQEVSEVYIEVIRCIYKNNTAKIKLENLGPSFPIERGLRQGDPLSSTIFITILETIFSKLDWNKLGLYIHDAFLSHLRFADDIVILSETSSQLQYMIKSLQLASADVGLEINLTKTMTMTNSCKIPILINGSPLEYAEKYIYLGKTISFDKTNNDIEIGRRVQQTWNKYWSLKEIFKSNMPVKIKTKIMNSSLLPCLTYGCQTWKFTAKSKQKINT
ncbi:jg21798, partial [Pararge aegeria aegeria]